MAFTIQPYTLGDTITPNTTYSHPVLTHSATALTSTYRKVVLEATTKTPVDDAWSNILPADYVVNGEVCGTMLDFTGFTSQPLYFRVPITDPAVKYATIKLNTLGFNYPDVAEIKTYEDASGATSGYWDITSLVEKGSVHTLSVVQANLGVSDPNITQPVINILGVGADSNVRSVMREGQQGPAQFPFLPDSLRTVVHLSAPEGFTYKFTVQKVNFGGASGGSFDPTQDADITGTWSFSNVSGLTMKDEAQILLGQGENALKIHGTGAGKAVIEGGNATNLDIAIPTNFQYAITAHETVTFDSHTISTQKDILNFVGPSLTMRVAQSVDGNIHIGPSTGGGLSIGSGGACAFSNHVYFAGSSFSSAVTMASTLTVADLSTFNKGVAIPSTGLAYFGTRVNLSGTEEGDFVINGEPGREFVTNLVFTKRVSPDQVTKIFDITHTTVERYGCYLQYTSNNGYLQFYNKYNLGSVSDNLVFTMEPLGQLNFKKQVTFAGPTSFTNAVTFGNTITVAGLATLRGHVKVKGHIGLGATDGSPEINITPESPNQLTLLGDRGAHIDIYTPPESSGGTPLMAKDKLLTQGECDARYVLFVQTTQAEYDGIAVKNPGTIYHTQDTGEFYIGDKQLTTA